MHTYIRTYIHTYSHTHSYTVTHINLYLYLSGDHNCYQQNFEILLNYKALEIYFYKKKRKEK